jgi:hypothetical protein
MENFNNNPAEEAVVETPEVVEAPVVEETPVVETPVVEEAPVAPVQEEPKTEEPTAITAPSYAGSDSVQAVGTVANGAIGATTVKREPRKAAASKPAKEEKTVAIKSTKNVSWVGVGKVSKGINIVSQKEADQWLTRDHITLVTPEEVKSEFGA